ncbi:hypothetical protein P5609_001395 [Bacillus licheniformis]|uniref:hypothetical protein n=1 Tax=Bacillus licheniformis TaxID=1402 RepID=UPI00018C8059|nr:hypothetical protein [Bacillus licheniformis]MDH3162344.1 hypothetical protein [Bacillus licheniformis]MED4409030.1 hypothetical protein [Bacillus licheniformis]QDL76916.1 hypothetical protein D9Y32_05315 [Bacillus licheniformis]
MAKNFVEHHIQEGAFHTFKVEAGQVVKIGQVVEVTPNGGVQVAGAGSTKVLGVVYSGTVGVDGKNVGYSGDNNEVATVVALKPLVYLEANETINAGDMVEAGTNGTIVVHNEGATYLANEGHQKIGLALQNGNAGERILIALG